SLVDQGAERLGPSLMQPPVLPGMLVHGAFLRWPPWPAAGLRLTSSPEECALSFFHQSRDTTPAATRLPRSVTESPLTTPSLQAMPDGYAFRRRIVRVMLRPAYWPSLPGWLLKTASLPFSRRLSPAGVEGQARSANWETSHRRGFHPTSPAG